MFKLNLEKELLDEYSLEELLEMNNISDVDLVLLLLKEGYLIYPQDKIGYENEIEEEDT
jgi:hypothetical protein